MRLAMVQPLGVPVPGYLIQTDDGIIILVDTGYPRSFIEEPPGPDGATEPAGGDAPGGSHCQPAGLHRAAAR